jgi:hypothetical protein
MDSFERFNESQLPPIECFYSKLNNETITSENYEYAKEIWNYFGINNLGEYHDLYVTVDTLLLADVFESHRDLCLENYGLDPAWYITAPGFAWDALLKLT